MLNYNLSFKTPFHYLQIFLEEKIFAEEELAGLNSQQRASVCNLSEEVSSLLIDLTLFLYHMYQFTALAVASSVVAVVRDLLGFEGWPSRMQVKTGILS